MQCCIHPLEKSFDQLGFSEWFGWSGIWDCTEAEVAVKGVGMIAAGGKGGLTSFPTFIGGRSPQSCTVTDFEMETSNFVLFLSFQSFQSILGYI